MRLIVAAGVEPPIPDREGLDPLAIRQGARRPGLLPLIPEETGRLVERAGVELAAKHHHPANRLSLGKLSAVFPFLATPIAVDLSPLVEIFRFRQGGTRQPVLADPRVQLPVQRRQGRHRIAAVGSPQVGPCILLIQLPNPTGPGGFRLAGPGEQRPVVHAEGEDQQGVPRPAMIGPLWFIPAIVDSKFELPEIRLAAGHPGVCHESQRKPLATPFIKPAGD